MQRPSDFATRAGTLVEQLSITCGSGCFSDRFGGRTASIPDRRTSAGLFERSNRSTPEGTPHLAPIHRFQALLTLVRRLSQTATAAGMFTSTRSLVLRSPKFSPTNRRPGPSRDSRSETLARQPEVAGCGACGGPSSLLTPPGRCWLARAGLFWEGCRVAEGTSVSATGWRR